ncbi:restriction endonuclease [Streptomyces sp. NPDC059009]|uniref:restriction endonuclease n=1 Tax=Streptomyces sp. NPDC059009 TaxID=3346694 RepID=UPI003680BBC1
MASNARSRRGGRLRRSRGRHDVSVALVVLLALAAFALVRMALDHVAVTAGVLTFAIGAGGITLGVRGARRRAIRSGIYGSLSEADVDNMTAGEFEQFLALLCERDGCSDVRVVGGPNDHAADILYRAPGGDRCLIQAKRYGRRNSVGNEHVQMVNGTYRDAHRCTRAALVTTSHFTSAAQRFAEHVGIELVDGTRLKAWMNGRRSAVPWR